MVSVLLLKNGDRKHDRNHSTDSMQLGLCFQRQKPPNSMSNDHTSYQDDGRDLPKCKITSMGQELK